MPYIQPINYAPPPPLHRRRVFRWWIYAVVLLGVFASGWWWVPPARRRVQLLYWQHWCMVYTPPVNQVIYDNNNPAIKVIPKEWLHFYTLFSPPGLRSEGTAFLHMMKNPKGELRLVAIDILRAPNMEFGDAQARVFKPGNLFMSPVESRTGAEEDFPLTDECLTHMKVFAGLIDPYDPTHFKVLASGWDGKKIVFDGWLRNDDRIDFGPRKK